MKQLKARIAYQRNMYVPQAFASAFIAEQVMNETGLTALCYGYGAIGKLTVFADDQITEITHAQLYEDAISLALGIYEIQLPHIDTCNRLVCNCKIH